MTPRPLRSSPVGQRQAFQIISGAIGSAGATASDGSQKACAASPNLRRTFGAGWINGRAAIVMAGPWLWSRLMCVREVVELQHPWRSDRGLNGRSTTRSVFSACQRSWLHQDAATSEHPGGFGCCLSATPCSWWSCPVLAP